jgi:hypothetical protein
LFQNNNQIIDLDEFHDKPVEKNGLSQEDGFGKSQSSERR